MNKKGEGMTLLISLLVIGLLSLGGLVVYKTYIAPATGIGGLKPEQVQATSKCPDTLKKAYFRAVDSDAVPAIQIGGTAYIYNDAGIQVGTDTLSGTAGSWSTGWQGCTAGKTYKVVLPTSAGKNTSVSTTFKVGFEDEYVEPLMEGNQLSNLNVRIKDRDTDSYLYLRTVASMGTGQNTNSTSYAIVNNTVASATQTIASNATSVGTSGTAKFKLYLRSANPRRTFGDPNLKTYMCLDVGTDSHYDTPTVSMNGVNLPDVKGTLSANNDGNDGRYNSIASSEYCYNMNTPFPYAEQQVDIDVPAVAGVDPDSDGDDLILYFLPEGVFRSVKVDTFNKPLVGVVTDASTQVSAGILPSTTPAIKLTIA
jgi:hypothetical protein